MLGILTSFSAMIGSIQSQCSTTQRIRAHRRVCELVCGEWKRAFVSKFLCAWELLDSIGVR